ncbi:hypothetical protein K2X85_04355 [bacterium]|nr:hypothetical protein [bacterium]
MRSWWRTLAMMMAVMAPVVVLASLLQMTLMQPRSRDAEPLDSDIATPVAAEGQKTSDSTGNERPPQTLALPTIDELTPRSTPSPSTNEVVVRMPTTLSEPEVSKLGAGAVGEAAESSENGPRKTTILRREGSIVRDLVGTISKQGLHVVFTPKDNTPPMNILANQLLERIESFQDGAGRPTTETPWRLSGRVTEYRGTNYLLITTASQTDLPPNP